MAITSGFPPVNTVAPGIWISELDLTFQPTTTSTSQIGLVGFASKGPINQPTLITSLLGLTQTFGYPHPDSSDPYMIYAAQVCLQTATVLYMVRVAETDNVNSEQATTASVAIPASGGQINIVSNVAGSYTFSQDSFFRFRLNGVLSSKTLVVLQGTYTATILADTLNEQLSTTIDGIQFYVTTIGSNTFISVETVFAYGPSSSLELVSVQDSIYGGPDSITGLGQSMTQAQVNGTTDRYPFVYQTAGQYDFTDIPTGANLQIVVDGTDNVLIDNVIQVVDLDSLVGAVWTAEEVVTTINDQLIVNGGTLPGGFEAYLVGFPSDPADGTNIGIQTLSFGVDAQIRVKSDSTVSDVFGLLDFTASGTSPVGTSGGATYAYGIVNGSSNTSNVNTFTIMADSPGQDGNSTQVVIANNISNNTFTIYVYNNGAQVESWGGLTKDSTSTYYVSSYIALVSNWISVVDNANVPASPLAGTYSLLGGSDGIPSDPDVQDQLLLGNQVGYTGLYSMSDPEQINIDLVAIPGHSSTTVVLGLLDFCQTLRQDCLAIIDPPFGLTVSEVVAWQNGAHPLNNTLLDNDCGALYWPWVKIRDTYNGLDIWAPPSGSVMATAANSDNLSAPWFSYAGLNRGNVPGISDVFNRPNRSDRNSMYGNNNAVNPIIQFSNNDGFYIWGNKTLQRENSALNRVSVRRMLFYVEKQIRAACLTLLFEPNDSATWNKFVRIANNILNTVQVGQGINAFIVVCDATTNTNTSVENNILNAQIGIQPEYDVEYIFIEFALFPLGTFSESNTSGTNLNISVT